MLSSEKIQICTPWITISAVWIKQEKTLFNFLKIFYLNLATCNYAVLYKNKYFALQNVWCLYELPDLIIITIVLRFK